MNALRLALLLGLVLAPLAGCGGVARPDTPAPVAVHAPSFARPVSYETGSDPAAVAVADLNGDGRGDIVTTNSKAVSVLLTDGQRTDYEPGGSSLAIADVNHDGGADVVVAGHRRSVSVLLNRGNGRFRAGDTYETEGTPLAVAVGDLNGDGQVDVVTANDIGTASVLLNRGGRFAARADYPAGDYPMSIAIADLNGDGKPDLATASNEGASLVLVNEGDGTFRRGRQFEATTGESYVVAADLNGEGQQDLAFASNDETGDYSDEEGGPTLYPSWIYIFPNKGKARFRPATMYYETGGYDEDIPALAASDLNRDGRLDVVFAHWLGSSGIGAVSVLFNSGDAKLAGRVDYPVGEFDYDFALAVGDVNGDGRPDLVTADAQGDHVSVSFNTPGLCTVQDVSGLALQQNPMTLQAATRALERAHCRVGTVREDAAELGEADGRVVDQKPQFGAVLPGGAKVDLVVSKTGK